MPSWYLALCLAVSWDGQIGKAVGLIAVAVIQKTRFEPVEYVDVHTPWRSAYSGAA
jgi:hypothetical protein